MPKVAIYVLVFLTFVSGSCASTEQAVEKAECKETAKPDCMCTMQYDPVCGCNNKTYGNACEAECHGITKYTKGPCKQ